MHVSTRWSSQLPSCVSAFRPFLGTSLFPEQFLDLALERVVILVALDVLSARVDMPNDSVAIEEKADTRPASRITVQPPLLQRSPLRINRDWEFKAEMSDMFFHRANFERLGGLVMIKSN